MILSINYLLVLASDGINVTVHWRNSRDAQLFSSVLFIIDFLSEEVKKVNTEFTQVADNVNSS
jgi:hypothetical protein